MSKLIIIGNGVAGASLAVRAKELDPSREVILISNESPYFFSRPALMYIYMGHMTEKQTRPYEDHKWNEWGIKRIQDTVINIEYTQKKCILQDNGEITYDDLVIATGSKPNKFGWPGQDADAVHGLYSLQDLYSMEKYTPTTKRAVIVGGGLIGIEMAEMFLSRGIEVIFLVREKLFWKSILPTDESQLVTSHILEHHVDLKLETELKEIKKDDNNRVSSIITSDDEEIICQFVGLTAGVTPNIEFLKQSALECDRGVLIDRQFRTNIENVYAVGDCAQFKEAYEGRRPIEQVWYTGKNQALALAENICTDNSSDYKPGIWFNSAKFFDIEYQTYGMVLGKLDETEDTIVWNDSKNKRLVRINYKKDTKVVTGFNLMGIRGRHVVCEKWIDEQALLKDVIINLGAMNFDPEFFKRFETEVLQTYNKKFPNENIELKTHKGLFSRFFTKVGGV